MAIAENSSPDATNEKSDTIANEILGMILQDPGMKAWYLEFIQGPDYPDYCPKRGTLDEVDLKLKFSSYNF